MSTGNKIKIGVLAIQGSFAEHLDVLSRLNVPAIEVRTKEELDQVSGLIIPGGESTTIGKLLKFYGLDEEIKKRAGLRQNRKNTHNTRNRGNAWDTKNSEENPIHSIPSILSVWGTCAGAILLAKEVAEPRPDILGLLDISIVRNAYGPQIESFETTVSIPKLGKKPTSAVFIRAPIISRVGRGVEVLGSYQAELSKHDVPVIVKYNNLLASTFHPELTNDTRVHEYFVALTKSYANRKEE